jgi:hypothetical protein
MAADLAYLLAIVEGNRVTGPFEGGLRSFVEEELRSFIGEELRSFTAKGTIVVVDTLNFVIEIASSFPFAHFAS